MSLNGTWVPQDETEDRLMEDLHLATRRAHSDGVSRRRIAALLAFMSSATLDPASEIDAEQRADRATLEELLEEALSEDTKEPEDCPRCGNLIGQVQAQMGGDHHVRPCGCRFESVIAEERLGDWYVSAEEDDESPD